MFHFGGCGFFKLIVSFWEPRQGMKLSLHQKMCLGKSRLNDCLLIRENVLQRCRSRCWWRWWSSLHAGNSSTTELTELGFPLAWRAAKKPEVLFCSLCSCWEDFQLSNEPLFVKIGGRWAELKGFCKCTSVPDTAYQQLGNTGLRV